MNLSTRNSKGQFRKGLTPWNKGKFGVKTCEGCGVVLRPKPGKLSRARFCGKACAKMGNRNPSWVGDRVSYSSLHIWISRYGQKADRCEFCGSNKWLEWSNVSGKYKRDINDFQTLCAKCHRIYDRDGRIYAT
jgi:hypothetical protein